MDINQVGALLTALGLAQKQSPAFRNIEKAIRDELNEIEVSLDTKASLQADPVVNPAGIPKEPSVAVEDGELVTEEELEESEDTDDGRRAL